MTQETKTDEEDEKEQTNVKDFRPGTLEMDMSLAPSFEALAI